MNDNKLPGSDGEHLLQLEYQTREKAKSFYEREVHSYITETMEEFIAKQTMFFISTSDKDGECDSSFRNGSSICILDKKRFAYPEFHGNGVMASLGNISENPNIGLLFIDFFETLSGLHINGKAHILNLDSSNNLLQKNDMTKLQNFSKGLAKEQVTWVLVDVLEAYIHCSKNIPQLRR